MSVVDSNGALLTVKAGMCAMAEIVRKSQAAEYVISHPVQTFAILNLFEAIELKPGSTPLKGTGLTFMGFRVIADEHFPEDRIEFRNAQHETVCALTNLAIPRPDGDQ